MSLNTPSDPQSQKPVFRRRRLFPRSLAECMDPVTKPAFQKNGLLEARIIRDWKHIMGTEIAQFTCPQKLTFPRGKTSEGTLSILACTGYALKLQYQTPLLLEKLAVYFGYKALIRIQIQQVHALPVLTYACDPVRYAPADAPGDMPQNDPLEAALEQLRRTMQKKKKLDMDCA